MADLMYVGLTLLLLVLSLGFVRLCESMLEHRK